MGRVKANNVENSLIKSRKLLTAVTFLSWTLDESIFELRRVDECVRHFSHEPDFLTGLYPP